LPTVGAGLGGIAQAAGNVARSRLSSALGIGEAAESGRTAAWNAFNPSRGSMPATASGDASGVAPAWAQRLRSEQAARHHRHVAMQTLKEGDRGGASATPDIKEKED
jgi:type IV secretion system protein TrbL